MQTPDTPEPEQRRMVFGNGSDGLLSALARLRREGRSHTIGRGPRGEVIVDYGTATGEPQLDENDNLSTH